jgi:hypothetical protein
LRAVLLLAQRRASEAMSLYLQLSSLCPGRAVASEYLTGTVLRAGLSFVSVQGHASEAMSLYLQLSKLGPAAGTTSSAALAKLARAAAAADDADAIQLLQKQLPGETGSRHRWQRPFSAPGWSSAVSIAESVLRCFKPCASALKADTMPNAACLADVPRRSVLRSCCAATPMCSCVRQAGSGSGPRRL